MVRIRSRKSWDVLCPPPKMIRVEKLGLVPTVHGGLMGMRRVGSKKRRLCLEVHGNFYDDGIDDEEAALSPAPSFDVVDGDDLPRTIEDFHPGDGVVLRLLNPRKRIEKILTNSHSDDSNDLGEEYRKYNVLNEIGTGTKDYRTPTKKSFEAQLGRGNKVEVRELIFESESDLTDFIDDLDRLHSLELERAEKRRLRYIELRKTAEGSSGSNDHTESKSQGATSTSTPEKENGSKDTENLTTNLQHFQQRGLSDVSAIMDEDVNLIIEVVSATDLQTDDLQYFDPYVVVWLGKKKVHRTKPILRKTDPIWNVHTGSMFILSVTSHEFFQSSGLDFVIKNHNSVSANEVIGDVTLSHKQLLDAKGERVEYVILNTSGPAQRRRTSLFGSTVLRWPKLNIRVRPARKEDFLFMKSVSSDTGSPSYGVYAEAAFISPWVHPGTILKAQTKHTTSVDQVPADNEDEEGSGNDKIVIQHKVKHRVKPGPDPDRPKDETKWMTKEEIEEEHLKPSTRWVDIGNGGLGRVYFEVLRCDGLPNMDRVGKSDAFCAIIYEDTVLNTVVINNCLSPRWMPWTQRAFIFHMNNPSSQIHVGVFDFDSGPTMKTIKHDAIGRVSIDVTNLIFTPQKTDYVLSYDLYRSVLTGSDTRQPQGKLTVRIRLDVEDLRRVIMTPLRELPERSYVNLDNKNEFHAARYVTHGEENIHFFDLQSLANYTNELQDYLGVVHYVEQAFLTVVLWRGHCKVNLFGRFRFELALHSIFAFMMGIFLAENCNLLPSVFLFSVAWFFLATNEQRRRNPSPWHHPATFCQMWGYFLFGRGKAPELIKNDPELEPLVTEYSNTIREKEKNKQEVCTTFLGDTFGKDEVDYIEDIESGVDGYTLNIIRPILLPIQEGLGETCGTLRIVKSIISWDESIYTFLITNCCIISGLLCLFVPWDILVHWTLRIIVWVFLGPWMKLVDIFIVKKYFDENSAAVKELRVAKSLKRHRMIRIENALKLRAMKQHMFGRYSVGVPGFKGNQRYPDIPRIESTASPHDDGYSSSVNIVEHKHGQKLVGDMVPIWGGKEEENAIASVQSHMEKTKRTKRSIFNWYKSK